MQSERYKVPLHPRVDKSLSYGYFSVCLAQGTRSPLQEMGVEELALIMRGDLFFTSWDFNNRFVKPYITAYV